MAFRPFITSLLGLDGTPESGGLLRSVVKGTSTPLPLYSDSAGAVPLTNPVVATSLGTIVCYFNDTLEYSWQAKTADNATTLWEANVVSGVLSLTYVNPEYSEHPIIEASWVPALGTPLGTGWPAAFAQDIDEILDDAKGIRVCATYAEMTALTADELTDNRVYCTYARAAEEDGGFGFWRYDSGSSATANGGTVLAIDGGGAGRFFRLIESEICVSWFTDGNASGTAQASLTDVSTAMRAFFAECYSTGLMGKLNRGKRTYAVSQDASTGYCLADGGISLEGCASPDSDFCPQIVPMTGVGSSVDIVRRTPVTGTIDRPIWRNVRINQLYSGSPLGRHAVYAHYTNDSESLLTEYTENRFDGGNSYALKTVGVGATNPQGVPFAPVIERNYFGAGLWTEDVADSSKINGNVIRRSGNLYAWYYSPVDDIFGIPQKAHFFQNNIDGTVYLAKGYGIEIESLDLEVSTGTNDAAIEIAAACQDTTINNLAAGVFGTASLGAFIKNYGTRTRLKNFRIDTAPTGGGFTAPTYGIRNESGGTMTIELDGSYLRSGRFGTDISEVDANSIKYIWTGPASTDNGVARFDGTTGKLQNSSATTLDDNGRFIADAGAVANPTYGFGSGLGWYRPSAGIIGLASGSVKQWELGQQMLATNGGTFMSGNGSASAPGHRFANDADSGLYLIGDGNVGLAIGGALKVDFDASRTRFTTPIHFAPGASVTPATNGDVTFELTSNTSLTVKAKGSDGTVRTVVLTLA